MGPVHTNIILIPEHIFSELTPELQASVRREGKGSAKPIIFATSTERQFVLADLGTDIYKAGRLVAENRSILGQNLDNLIFRDTALEIRHVDLDTVSEDPHWLVSNSEVVSAWAVVQDDPTEDREYLLVGDSRIDIGAADFAVAN